MLALPVPDFFQEDSEDALRSRVQWLQGEIGFGDSFFTRLLRMDEGAFTRWKERRAILLHRDLLGLQDVWEMMMHILSFVNFDSDRARCLLEHIPPAVVREGETDQTPPWAGSSIKSYLETRGPAAVGNVNRWITSFRFVAPSPTPEQEVPCLSSPD
jgi:hypothetical protein